MNDAADDETTDRAHNKNWSVGFSDNSAGEAKHEAKQSSNEPARPRKGDAADYHSNAKALNESGTKGRGLVREFHSRHKANGKSAKYETSDHSEN